MQHDLVGTGAIYAVTAIQFSVYLKWRDDMGPEDAPGPCRRGGDAGKAR
ncbi:hypothetical protein ACFV0L_35615 [Streptosporangium canum]